MCETTTRSACHYPGAQQLYRNTVDYLKNCTRRSRYQLDAQSSMKKFTRADHFYIKTTASLWKPTTTTIVLGKKGSDIFTRCQYQHHRHDHLTSASRRIKWARGWADCPARRAATGPAADDEGSRSARLRAARAAPRTPPRGPRSSARASCGRDARTALRGRGII